MKNLTTATATTEKWEEVKGFEDYYEVSSLGRVRSKDRKVNGKNGSVAERKGKMIKPFITGNGYLTVTLRVGNIRQNGRIHKLVAEAFLGHTSTDGLVVDHINEVKDDNRLCNLQVITHRENVSKSKRFNRLKDNKTSKYTGVRLLKSGKWNAQFYTNGRNESLGCFTIEEDAAKAYQKRLAKHIAEMA